MSTPRGVLHGSSARWWRSAILAVAPLVAQMVCVPGATAQVAPLVRPTDRAGREDVPRLVAELVAAGERIYGVRVVRGDLEDVYLDLVGGDGV